MTYQPSATTASARTIPATTDQEQPGADSAHGWMSTHTWTGTHSCRGTHSWMGEEAGAPRDGEGVRVPVLGTLDPGRATHSP